MIKKRCPRCDNLYDLPSSDKRTLHLVSRYCPCPFCGYVESNISMDENNSGRCKECFIPFTMVKHHGKGMCHRCHTKVWRDDKKNKDNQITSQI